MSKSKRNATTVERDDDPIGLDALDDLLFGREPKTRVFTYDANCGRFAGMQCELSESDYQAMFSPEAQRALDLFSVPIFNLALERRGEPFDLKIIARYEPDAARELWTPTRADWPAHVDDVRLALSVLATLYCTHVPKPYCNGYHMKVGFWDDDLVELTLHPIFLAEPSAT